MSPGKLQGNSQQRNSWGVNLASREVPASSQSGVGFGSRSIGIKHIGDNVGVVKNMSSPLLKCPNIQPLLEDILGELAPFYPNSENTHDRVEGSKEDKNRDFVTALELTDSRRPHRTPYLYQDCRVPMTITNNSHSKSDVKDIGQNKFPQLHSLQDQQQQQQQQQSIEVQPPLEEQMDSQRRQHQQSEQQQQPEAKLHLQESLQMSNAKMLTGIQNQDHNANKADMRQYEAKCASPSTKHIYDNLTSHRFESQSATNLNKLEPPKLPQTGPHSQPLNCAEGQRPLPSLPLTVRLTNTSSLSDSERLREKYNVCDYGVSRTVKSGIENINSKAGEKKPLCLSNDNIHVEKSTFLNRLNLLKSFQTAKKRTDSVKYNNNNNSPTNNFTTIPSLTVTSSCPATSSAPIQQVSMAEILPSKIHPTSSSHSYLSRATKSSISTPSSVTHLNHLAMGGSTALNVRNEIVTGTGELDASMALLERSTSTPQLQRAVSSKTGNCLQTYESRQNGEYCYIPDGGSFDEDIPVGQSANSGGDQRIARLKNAFLWQAVVSVDTASDRDRVTSLTPKRHISGGTQQHDRYNGRPTTLRGVPGFGNDGMELLQENVAWKKPISNYRSVDPYPNKIRLSLQIDREPTTGARRGENPTGRSMSGSFCCNDISNSYVYDSDNQLRVTRGSEPSLPATFLVSPPPSIDVTSSAMLNRFAMKSNNSPHQVGQLKQSPGRASFDSATLGYVSQVVGRFTDGANEASRTCSSDSEAVYGGEQDTTRSVYKKIELIC